MTFFFSLFLFFSVFLVPPRSFAASSADTIDGFKARVTTATLSNGLRVLLVERPVSPVVTFVMFIRTGAIDDESGKSGLAHMFEHMLFKGTKTLGTKDYPSEEKVLNDIDSIEAEIEQLQADDTESALKTARLKELQEKRAEKNDEHAALIQPEAFWKKYEAAGAQDFNAGTGYDFTHYVVSLPSSEIPLWMSMETDRLKNPVLREFYKERDVVMEERRMRIDNSPDGKLWEAFLATAFMAHPYGRPIVGWESDLKHLSRADAQSFFERHYDISRFVLVVVGDIKPAAFLEELRPNFESIPSKGVFPETPITVEPKQDGVRRADVITEAEPGILIGYHRPNMKDKDEAAFVVLADLLAGNRSARLERSLVQNKKMAVSISANANAPGERAPSLFVISATPQGKTTTAQLESEIDAALADIAQNGCTEEELARVKTQARLEALKLFESNESVAFQLGYYESVGGDWHMLFESLENIDHVAIPDVQRVAATYLTPANKTVAVLLKKG